MAAVQIVDIGDIGLSCVEPCRASLLSVGQEVVAAFRSTGFAYLSHHGVSAALQQETFAAARDFFSLDTEVKLRYERFVKTGFNGYTPVGGENTGLLSDDRLLDYKECYDFHIFGQDYPDAVLPGFSQKLEQLALACCQLSGRLLTAVEEALLNNQPLATGDHQLKHGDQKLTDGDRKLTTDGQKLTANCQELPTDDLQHKADEENPTENRRVAHDDKPTDERQKPTRKLTNSHQRMLQAGGCSALRVLCYPPVPATARAGMTRCASHTDYGTLSMLFQDELGGLQVQTTDGTWLPVTPIPDTIVVNVGDLMETWSSGRLRATKHRVIIPHEETLRRRARQSMVLFVEPDEDVLVHPLDGDPRFPPINAGQALRRKLSATYPVFPAQQWSG